MEPVVLQKDSTAKEQHEAKTLLGLSFKLFASTSDIGGRNEIVLIAAPLKSLLKDKADFFKVYLVQQHSDTAALTAVLNESCGRLENIATQLSDYEKFHELIDRYGANASTPVDLVSVKTKLFSLRKIPELSKCFDEYEIQLDAEVFSFKEIDFQEFLV
ncbi:hypothetical protein QR680_017956 [Steinernema hermaphroditum]|uniref:Uncharacterized protein n=1 Tax=Steinernema hermaphroditum TaxID=289476 RepID=A0AA39LQB4_9BILA|nr:hypothetical protein QR680_017956 [Steinernema hermaphroditum]